VVLVRAIKDMASPTRKEKRIPAVVPLRINAINEDGQPVHCMAHTLNVSRRGALIAGVTLKLRLGVIVRLVRGRANAAFKVVWLGDPEGASKHQVGVESLEVVSNFWGLEQLNPVSALEEIEASQKRTSGAKKK
jgi:hypothetical protein